MSVDYSHYPKGIIMKIKGPAKQYNKIILPMPTIDKTINKHFENQLPSPEGIIKIGENPISKPNMINKDKNRKTYLKSPDEYILLLTIIANHYCCNKAISSSEKNHAIGRREQPLPRNNGDK